MASSSPTIRANNIWTAAPVSGALNSAITTSGSPRSPTRPCRNLDFQIFRHASHKAAIDLSERLLEIAPVKCPSPAAVFRIGGERHRRQNRLVLLERPRQAQTAQDHHAHGQLSWFDLRGHEHDRQRRVSPQLRPAVSEFLHTDLPNHYRNALPGETEQEFSSRLADSLERMILAEGGNHRRILGRSGAGQRRRAPPPAGFEKVRRC